MGLLDRLIGGVNRAHDAATDAEHAIFADRRYAQSDRLTAEGISDEGVLTGIKQRWNDDTTDTILRVSWFAPDERHHPILLGTGRTDGLRLGATVAIRTDGDDAVLDWDRMGAVWGGPDGAPTQRRGRSLPDPRLDDTAVDLRVLRRTKKWRPGRGELVSCAHVTVFGLATQNWDVQVRCTGGTLGTMRKDAVPFYARWYAAPGADVPILIDPGDPSAVQVDWRRLAAERADTAGRWQDPPPPGSIAAAVLLAAQAAPQPEATTPQDVDPQPAPDALAPIEGVDLQRWAAMQIGVQKARVAPAQYDEWATAEFGVPPGRYTAIDRAWQARMTSPDWRVGAAMGEALQAARKQAKRR